jgi:hypothetical protein
MSQQAQPRIEPAFGWLKTIGWLRKSTPRRGESGLARRVRERRVQSDPVAEIAGEACLTTATSPRSAAPASVRRPHGMLDVQ